MNRGQSLALIPCVGGAQLEMISFVAACAPENVNVAATADEIRDELAALGVEIKDSKDGTTWKRKQQI